MPARPTPDPIDSFDPLPTTAAFDAAVGPGLLALLDAHDAVRTELARLMDETDPGSEDAETPARGSQTVLGLSDYLDELREALAGKLRQRRNDVVRASEVAGREAAEASAPS